MSTPRTKYRIAAVSMYLLITVLALLGSVFLSAAIWVNVKFGIITVDQILVHAQGGLDGVVTGDASMVSSFIQWALIFPTAVVAAAAALVFLLSYRSKKKRVQSETLPDVDLGTPATSSDADIALAVIDADAEVSPQLPDQAEDQKQQPEQAELEDQEQTQEQNALVVKKRRRLTLRSTALMMSALLFLGGSTLLANQISLIQAIRANLSGESLSSFYASPAGAQAPDKKLNLITIYLESMEAVYSDEDTRGFSLTEPLDNQTDGWASIDSLNQAVGGGWTMAGVINTQCGIPLKSEVLAIGQPPAEGDLDDKPDLNKIGNGSETYLPGAVCLGDVLEQAGYTNQFMGGADGTFASKKTFMTTHGYSDFRDLSTWIQHGEDDFNDWGLRDRRLLELASERVSELRAEPAPFHLTILTVDSHNPGYIEPTCTAEEGTDLDRAIYCSLESVAQFVEDLDASGALEDTAVVVMGDHLAMLNSSDIFAKSSDRGTERTIYNRIWHPDGVSIQRESTDQYSMLPTILDLLDFELPNGQAGIGVSLLGDYSLDKTIYALDLDDRTNRILAPSNDLYTQLWLGAGD